MKNTNWKIDETHPQLAQRVQEDLRTIMDPELGMNVIELGLIREVKIEDAQSHVTMIFTSPFCPYAPRLLASCRGQVEKTLNMDTKISIGREIWDRTFMEEDDADWGLY
ncbi:MAG: iron-sulfur cluster assembly protein [Chloroflexota bacterium]|nr:iron-sulfur cluster assembly protein [Chloroflexota bacterium]